MIITLDNCVEIFKQENPIKKSRVYGRNNINQYKLLEDVAIKLSFGDVIKIPKGYIWDLASVPRLLWAIVPPDSDAELAFLLHDFLYEYRLYPKKVCDNEMKVFSKELNGTKGISLRNVDNNIRYYAVKWFGKKAYINN